MTEDLIPIKTHDIFKVPLFSIHLAGFTDDLKIKELLENQFVENKKSDVAAWHVTQTNSNLHEKKEFAPLVQVIGDVAYSIITDIMEYDPTYFAHVTAMWANRQPKGAFFRSHTHHNNILSGVFYPDFDKEFPPINFQRPYVSDFAPTVMKSNKYNGGVSKFKPQKDTLIMFPSWLSHNVPANPSDKERLSISFNVMLRGVFSAAQSNQSTLF